MAKSIFETTAAEKKSIGFDYQYYFFLLQLLKINEGEEIGLEVKDDVHIEMSNGDLVLLQLKHTVQTNVDGDPINLTERDIDLWKTIHNWISIFSDPTQGRTSGSTQLNFIEKTKFVLVSNKGISTRNIFLVKLKEFNDETLSISEFKKYLENLDNNTNDSDANKSLKEYIANLINLNDNILTAFAKRIEFQLEEDDLIKKIKRRIEGYFVQSTQVDDTYHKLNSTLRDNNYFAVKNGKKIIISYNDFMANYRSCFPQFLNLPIRRHNLNLPSDYDKQTFIKQLLDIGDITGLDTDDMILYTKLKLLAFNNLSQWIQSGELSEEQKKIFTESSILQWRNLYKGKHRINSQKLRNGNKMSEIENDVITASLACLDEVRKIHLLIEEQKLDVDFSNGHFYLLSDEPLIGWHLDWESRYKVK
jgi:hypothetical protein